MQAALTAPCGMNCALCVSYLAMTNQLNQQGFSRRYCVGCQPRGKNCTYMQRHCDLVGHGLVRFCYECSEFPCRRLQTLDQRYRAKYHMSMLENLELIRDQGMERFLERERERWTCPDCGGAICCHNGLCLHCGLEKLRQNKRYRWGEQ